MSNEAQPANNNRGNNLASLTDASMYDEVHSALSIRTLGGLYKNAMILEMRPRDAAATGAVPRYVTENTFTMMFEGADCWVLAQQVRAFLDGRLSEIVVERKSKDITKQMLFCAGNEFYDESVPDMQEKCANALAIYMSEDDNEDRTCVFMSYGTPVVLEDNTDPVLLYPELEVFYSALVQMSSQFLRLDGTVVRTFNNTSGGGRGNSAPVRQPSLANRRPGAARPGTGRPGTTAAAANTASQADTASDDNEDLSTFVD